MLRLTLEIVPYGIEGAKRQLGTLEICNIGGTLTYGRYTVALNTDKGDHKHVEIGKFRRERGGWHLVRKALNALKI